MGSPTILCVGHVNWDVVIHANGVPDPEQSSEVEHRHASSGGSATNTALVLAGIDAVDTVNLVGSVGDDDAGDRVRKTLDDYGVEPVLAESEQTTVIQALITPDADPRYFHENAGVGEYGPDLLSDATWDSIDHVHLTSFDKEISEAFAASAAERGKTVSFNPSQMYRQSTFERVIEHADLVFLNQDESEVFTKRHGNLGSVVDSASGETDIVVTHGSAGCTLYSVDGLAHHEGFLAETVVDTVGAGDSFIAGFLSEWVVDDGSAEEALRVANAYGAASVTQAGAPDEIQKASVESFLSE